MARDATARLYDVDEDSVVFTKLQRTTKYDQGTVKFRARKGKLIDLDKLHESIWATRLSGGTRSGLVSLNVVAVGQVVVADNELILEVAGSNRRFKLAINREAKNVFTKLKSAPGSSAGTVRVEGVIDDYRGRWPNLLKRKPAATRRILVTGFEVEGS